MKTFYKLLILLPLVLLVGCSDDSSRSVRNQIREFSDIDIEVNVRQAFLSMTGSEIDSETSYIVDIHFNVADVSEVEFINTVDETISFIINIFDEKGYVENYNIRASLIEDDAERLEDNAGIFEDDAMQPILRWTTSSDRYPFGGLGGSFDFNWQQDVVFRNITLSDAHDVINSALRTQAICDRLTEHFGEFVHTEQVISVTYGEENEDEIGFSMEIITDIEFSGISITVTQPSYRSVRYFVDDTLNAYEFIGDVLREYDANLWSLRVGGINDSNYPTNRPSTDVLFWQFPESRYPNGISVLREDIEDFPYLSSEEIQTIINERFSDFIQLEDFLMERLNVDEIRVNPRWTFTEWSGGYSHSGYTVSILTTTPSINDFGNYIVDLSNQVEEIFESELGLYLARRGGSQSRGNIAITLAEHARWDSFLHVFNTGLEDIPEAAFNARVVYGNLDTTLRLTIGIDSVSEYIQYFLDEGAWE